MLRVILIFFALTLLAIPYLKLVGAALLLWIGVKLLLPEDEDAHGHVESSERLWGAIKTVIVADLVMSVDNVIAIAGAAQSTGGDHQMPLVIFGLLASNASRSRRASRTYSNRLRMRKTRMRRSERTKVSDRAPGRKMPI